MDIFVDGSNGITGMLMIEQLTALQSSYNFTITTLDSSLQKDEISRYRAIEKADIAILCLPEDIAFKTMQELSHVETTIIDISIAHRLDKQWIYGFHELSKEHTIKIQNSTRIANPGCFATGMISLLNPIKNYLNPAYPLIINGVTGYSAGGKKAIERQKSNPVSFRATNLNKVHPHISEVRHVTQLKNKLMFNPTVGNFERGQMVQITIFNDYLIGLDLHKIEQLFINYYEQSHVITVKKEKPSFLSAESMSGSNNLDVYVLHPEGSDFVQLIAVYDNLGKGSIGAASGTLEILLKDHKISVF